MEISDVRIRLLTDTNDRLKAVCSVTLGEQFVIRDIKLVDGTGGLFVAMPSRKLSAPCPNCRTQNHLRARYCNECGKQVPPARIPRDDNGREKAHRDIAHPITSTFRQAIQERVLEAYEEEMKNGPAQVDAVKDRDEKEQEQDERDVSAPETKVDDYNSMIADLDPGGSRSRTRESQSKAPEEPSGRRGGRGRGRDRPRDNERSDAGRKTEPAEPVAAGAPSSPARQAEHREDPAPAKREPAPSASRSSEGEDRTDGNETAFGWGLDEVEPPRPVKRDAPKVEEKEAPRVEPAPPVENVRSDDSGFGAGIL